MIHDRHCATCHSSCLPTYLSCLYYDTILFFLSQFTSFSPCHMVWPWRGEITESTTLSQHIHTYFDSSNHIAQHNISKLIILACPITIISVGKQWIIKERFSAFSLSFSPNISSSFPQPPKEKWLNKLKCPSSLKEITAGGLLGYGTRLQNVLNYSKSSITWLPDCRRLQIFIFIFYLPASIFVNFTMGFRTRVRLREMGCF